MALSGQLKLPPLKLTESLTKTSTIHRGVFARIEQHEGEAGPVANNTVVMEDEEPVQDLFCGDEDVLVIPSHHELETKASIKGWEELRSRFLSAGTECSAMPLGQPCLLCPSLAEYRCRECGPVAFYCMGCFNLLHEKTNFFHVPEKWEVSENTHQ